MDWKKYKREKPPRRRRQIEHGSDDFKRRFEAEIENINRISRMWTEEQRKATTPAPAGNEPAEAGNP